MADIAELDEVAHRLRISWRKAHNLYASFSSQFWEVKKQFANNQYPGWTFAQWLGIKAGLSEDQIYKQQKVFSDLVLAGEDREKLAEENRKQEAEKRAAKLAAEKLRHEEKLAEQEDRNQRKAERIKALEEGKALTNKENKLKAKPKPKRKSSPRIKSPKLIVPTGDRETILEKCEIGIRAGEAKVSRGSKEKIDGILEISFHMKVAADTCPSDTKLNEWLILKGFNYNDHDKSALIGFAHNPDMTRKVLEHTERGSYQYIWEKELKPKLTVIPINS